MVVSQSAVCTVIVLIAESLHGFCRDESYRTGRQIRNLKLTGPDSDAVCVVPNCAQSAPTEIGLVSPYYWKLKDSA